MLPSRRLRPLWPVAVAVLVRIAVWSWVPVSHLASDEDSYVKAGTLLAQTGQHDLFWPPLTPWLIAIIERVTGSANVAWIRLAWIGMDIACVVLIGTLATRVAFVIAADDRARRQFVVASTLGYAVYLPAISFSQFATSEIPALLLVLIVLVIATRSARRPWFTMLGGIAMGALVLSRTNLLPLLVAVPAALLVLRVPGAGRFTSVFVACATAVVAAAMLRNWWFDGQFVIATNSSYNLYIGNRDVYAEDLDLFHPAATLEQIEFRRQYFGGELTYPSEPPAELQRMAIVWIRSHPAIFVRRVVGRLARVFAPNTDVIELAGSERSTSVFATAPLALLSIANAQWSVVLFGGLVGLAALLRLSPRYGIPFVLTLLGCLPLCLVAIAKPRYAFVFEPLLLITSTISLLHWSRVRDALTKADWAAIFGVTAFLMWGWLAWAIFAVTSRLALTPHA